MFKDKLNFKLVNLLILLVIFYIVINTTNWWSGIISKIMSILFPFIISFAIAYAFYPLVRKLEEKGVRRSLSVASVVILTTIFILGLFVITIPLVYDQILTLYRLIGEVLTDFSLRFSIDLGGFENSISSIFNDIISSIGKYLSNGTIQFAIKSVDLITKFIIIYIVSIYLLSDMDKIRNNVKFWLKKSNAKGYKFIKAIDKDLGQYLQGLVIFMVIQLFEYCFLFWIVGHPNWLILGILASVTTVVPYFGGLITNIIAVILASVVSPKVFIATLIICLVAPNIDSYVISPKVYGKTNNINALWTIFSVFVGGALFGFIGIVIALPVYIIINRTYHFYKGDIKGKIEDIKVSQKTNRRNIN